MTMIAGDMSTADGIDRRSRHDIGEELIRFHLPI